jgi:hypothetical protein
VKVYALSRGSYSDYSVVAIFRDQKDAQAAIDTGQRDFNDVEEYDLYEGPVTQKIVYHAESRWERGANEWIERRWTWAVWPWNDDYDLKRPVVRSHPAKKPVYVFVAGPDEAEVAKALFDRMAQIKAQRELP